VSEYSSFLAVTDRYIPHTILAAGAIFVLALAAMFFVPESSHWILYLAIMVLSAAIAVDLSAHGYNH
jgi:ABC-type polysaccharide/polyol phosphate export permease